MITLTPSFQKEEIRKKTQRDRAPKTHMHIYGFIRYIPWFTNSEVLLVLLAPWASRGLFEVMLIWDRIALLSISIVLVLQKSSDMLFFLNGWPWILSLFDGSSTTVNLGWLQLPRQPLLCYKLVLSNHEND